MRSNYWWLVKNIFKGNIILFISILVTYILMGLLKSLNLLVLQNIIIVIGKYDLKKLMIAIAFFASIKIISGTETFIQGINALYIQKKIFKNFYKELCKKINHISILKFDQMEFLVILERARKSIDGKMSDFIQKILSLLAIFSTFISLIFIIINISPFFLLYFIIMSIIQNLILILNSKDTIRLLKNQDTKWHIENYYKNLLQNRNYAKEIRNYDCYNWIIKKRIDNYIGIEFEHLRFSKKWSVINVLAGIFLYALEGGIFFIALYQLYNKLITIDMAILLIQTQGMFCSTVFDCINQATAIREDFAYVESLLDIMNEEEYEKLSNNNSTEEKIVLNKVYFSYGNKFALKNINLQIKKNQKVALVGENGSGKSSLAKMIIGLIEPSKGKIISSNLGVAAIFQDFSKFYLSVKDNIFVGNYEEHINNVESFSKHDNRFEFINNLPKGLNTLLGPDFYNDGVELSGGEWQKICLLRVLVREADIIIFDEPTASMDPIAERECFQEIENLLKNKTVIIITHRIGLTKFADNILFLEDGEIKEEGTFKELLNSQGKFSNYYFDQCKWYY